MKLINIRMPDEEVSAIRAMADAECLTMSAFVRRVLRQRAVDHNLLPDQVQLLKVKGQLLIGDPPVPVPSVDRIDNLVEEPGPGPDDLTSTE